MHRKRNTEIRLHAQPRCHPEGYCPKDLSVTSKPDPSPSTAQDDNPSTRSYRAARHGVTAVLAMMYLVLFSTLAIGFFATTTMSVQISKNDTYSSKAQMAAESGLQYVRWHLDNVDVRANYDFTADPVFVAMYNQINARLQSTNMSGLSASLSADNKTIYIPGLSNSGAKKWLTLDGATDISGNPTGAAFTATITHSGDKFIVKVTGRNGTNNVQRALQLVFQKAANSSAILNFGVASKGRVATAGASWITGRGGIHVADPLGSVLAAESTDPNPVNIGGHGISGDISIVSQNSVTYAGASVGGTSISADIDANHVHKGISPPIFPDVDTTGFAAFATTQYVSGKTLNNMYIAPNTNPSFAGNVTINGVLLVYPPNVVTFNGNLTINGVIVAPASPGGSYPAFNATANVLKFSGNVTANAVDSKDPTTGNFNVPDAVAMPSGPSGPNLRTLTGSFILAPNFATTFGGSFGTVNGSIIAGQVTFSGNAGGNVLGSIINLQPNTLSINGSSDIQIIGTGTSNPPTGVNFGDHLAPQPGTYDEVQP